MKTVLGYGKQKIEFSVPENRIKEVLTPNKVKIELTGAAEVERALDFPFGSKKIEEIFSCLDRVAIITSDVTRPMPTKVVLPCVLRRLYKAGVKKENVVVVFALGSHRKHTEEEKKYLVGEEIYNDFIGRLLDSDETDVVRKGVTEKGTPADIFRPVAEADKVIALGNIEYHYFAGYSGGSKAVMPGVSTRAAIRENHSMMVLPEARSGNIDSPVRKDSEEVCLKFQPIDFLVNVVLNEKKEVIGCFCGDVIKAHRKGCDFLDGFYKKKLDKGADIVVVSSGGYPKDLNMYQAQKALDNASRAVRDGGAIIWLAECGEGFGSEVFEKWMTEYTPAERIENIRKNFVLGGHKAAAIALVCQRAKIFFVGKFDPKTVRKIGLTPCGSLAEAFDEATRLTGENSSVIVMPYGGSTLPVIEK